MTPESKIFGKIPFLRFTLAFTSGIILSQFVALSGKFNIFLIVAIVVLFTVKILVQHTTFFSKYASILFTLLFILGALLFTNLHFATLFDKNMPEKGTYMAYVSDKTPSANKRFRYIVNIEQAISNEKTLNVSEKIMISISDSAINKQLIPGHRIMFDASLREVTQNNNPGDFDYKAYLLRRGIRYQSNVWSEVHILPQEKRTLRSAAFNFRKLLLDKYQEAGIDGDEFAVLAALTLGDKNYLTNELRQSFASSGAMHVLAVSGLHVGIIYMILNMMFAQFCYSNRMKIFKMIALILLLWCYAFISGLSPSVMRASTMFTFVIVGENLKRKTNIYNTLAVSAFVLMLVNPLIIFEIGFQLSYAAVTAIVYFQPRIAALLPLKNKIMKYLWELFAVSVAAQIGTFVISIYYFNQFPVYFWISNYIVIPAAAALLYGALFFFLLSFIPYVPGIIARIIETITLAMNAGVKSVEALPGALITNIWIDDLTMILLFTTVIIIGWFSAQKQFRLLLSILAVFIMLTSNAIFNAVKINRQSEIIFFNTYNHSLLGIAQGKNFYYFNSLDTLSPYTINLISNAAQYFRTSAIHEIKPWNNKEQLVSRYNNYIIYQNIIIKAEKSKTENNHDEMFADIYWNTANGDIKLNDSSGLDINCFSSQNKIKADFVRNSTFNTKQGAIILSKTSQ